MKFKKWLKKRRQNMAQTQNTSSTFPHKKSDFVFAGARNTKKRGQEEMEKKKKKKRKTKKKKV